MGPLRKAEPSQLTVRVFPDGGPPPSNHALSQAAIPKSPPSPAPPAGFHAHSAIIQCLLYTGRSYIELTPPQPVLHSLPKEWHPIPPPQKSPGTCRTLPPLRHNSLSPWAPLPPFGPLSISRSSLLPAASFPFAASHIPTSPPSHLPTAFCIRALAPDHGLGEPG